MAEFSKYHFPDKVYLSGPDCFHLMLDLHAKKHGAGGNVMRKLFYFNHRINEEKVRSMLYRSPAIHWLCNIKLHRGFLFSLPFWKYHNANRQVGIFIHNTAKEDEFPESILRREMPVDAAAYIEADILYFPSGRSALVFSWNHILMDARGSAFLFEHLNRLAEGLSDPPELLFPGKEKEPGLLAYIRNMYKVKSFIEESSHKPVSSIVNKQVRINDDLPRNLVVTFSAEETIQVQKLGIATGSKFGPTHFYLACCAQIIHRLNIRRGNVGPVWVPVPYDGRMKGGEGPVFSNQVSFIFYRIDVDKLTTLPITVSDLSRQMAEQIRMKMPVKYNLLLSMMRHFPLWLYYFLISKTGEGTIASFLYTSTGDHFNQMPILMGEQVKEIGVIPALTFPPGFTFLFMMQDDHLHVNMSYLPEVINEEELNFVASGIKELLLHA